MKVTPTFFFVLGGIQVLRHHDFDLFWPTHPPYHQTSSFPIPTLMMTSSFPHTHPPINIFFFLSLINKAKIRQGLFLLKKNYLLHNNSGSFFQKKNQSLELNWSVITTLFSAHTNKSGFFLVYFLITSSFIQPHPPTLSSNIIIWPTHPPTSLMT